MPGRRRADTPASRAAATEPAEAAPPSQAAREVLPATDAELREAERIAAVGSWHWTAATDTVTWSDELFRIAGRDPSLGPPSFYTDQPRLYSPESWARLDGLVAEALASGAAYDTDLELVRADGTTRWVTASGRALRAPDGRIIGLHGVVQDVTDRGLSKRAVEDSAAMLREAQRIAHVGSWSWDAAADTVTWSEELFRIAGRDPSTDAPSYYTDHPGLYTTESWERLQPLVAEALETGAPYDIDLELNRQDGTTRWIAAKGEAVRTSDGRIAGLRGTVQDITERRAAQEAGRAAKTEIEDLFNNAPVGYHTLGADGTILRINDTELRWLGYDREEVVGKLKFSDLLAPATTREHETLFERFKATGIARDVEHDLVRRDGSILPVSLNATAITDAGGRYLGTRSTVWDITDRRRADQARARLAAVVEASRDAIIGTDPDGTIRTWNRGAQLLYGYAPDEVIGRSIAILQPDDLPGEVEIITGKVRAGNRVEHAETVRRHKDGHPVDVALSVWPIRDPAGVVVGASSVARDIAVRKRAMAALRASDAYHRGLIEASMDGLITVDADLRITDVNERMCVLAGIPRNALVGSPFPDHFTDPASATDGVLWTFSSGSVADHILTIRTLAGREVPVSFNASVYAGADGTVRGIFASVRDITERKRVEEELAERERFIARIAAMTPGLIDVRDLAMGGTVYANRDLGEFLGYPTKQAREMGDRAMFLLLHPDDAAEAAARVAEFNAARDGEVVEHEYRLRDAAGEWRRIHTRSVVFARAADGLATQVLSVGEDVTERRRMEEALLAREEQLAVVARNSPLSLWALDAAGRCTLYLGGGAPTQGLARDRDLVGLNFEQVFAARPDMQDRVRRVLAGETISGDLGYGNQVFTTHNAPVRDAAGRIIGAIGMTFEVTNERRLEADLAEARKLEAIGRLAGGVAHDFNNLLMAIAGYAELVRAELDEDDRRRPDVDQIIAASDRAADLVRQLLAFGRRAVVAPIVLDVNEVVSAILPLLHRLIGEDVQLDFAAGAGALRVKIDRGQLEQVLVNLVANARDAMPNGGRVSIGTEEVTIDEDYLAAHPSVQAGRRVLISVGDTGVGIDAEALGHIFEPFFTTKMKGTGLGLATVHGIVRQAGGHVVPSSEPGHGSTFRVYLPATRARRGHQPTPDDSDQTAVGTETILLVEDEEAVRKFVRRALESRGYTIAAAADGAEALDIVARTGRTIAALVTDVVLPGVSGPDLAERIAAIRPGIPVLFISGYAEQLLTRRGALGPGTAFLAKPFAAADLAAALRRLLDEHADAGTVPPAGDPARPDGIGSGSPGRTSP